MAWAWHGKCESDTATLCKSNGKDTFQTLSGTAWQGNRPEGSPQNLGLRPITEYHVAALFPLTG